MSRLHRFHGGIHPPLNKAQSLRQPIAQAPLAAELIFPLVQYGGHTARAVVGIGERVSRGQLLATPETSLGVPVYASAAGRIVALREHAFPHPSGRRVECLVLATEQETGGSEQDIQQGATDFRILQAGQILERIRNAGIVGMGGAGFPTAVKLQAALQQGVDTLIINAAECEPYISADEALLREQAEQVCQGIDILQHILSPQQCLIGIENSKPEAIAALREAIAGRNIQLAVIPTRYPSGGERQLIRILTGQEVPSGKTPLDIHVLCQNPATCRAIHHAVTLGAPLLSRVITLTGGALKKPCNLEVPLGTPIGGLLEYCGLQKQELAKLLHGGPLMGFIVQDPGMPVTAISNCLLAGTGAELPEPPPERDCIRCGFCAEACPAGLLPQQLQFFIRNDLPERAAATGLFDCIECGVCDHVCPSHIPLVHYYRAGKGQIRESQAEDERARYWQQRFEFRQLRVGQEQEARLARRGQRQLTREQQTAGDAATPVPAQTAMKSREALQQEIMAAVARSKARRAASEQTNRQKEGEE